MLKILHTGDMHLDSAFSSLSLADGERMREAQRDVFSKIMRYAKENSYDMVLISGDLFDGKYITPATRKQVLMSLGELDCPVIIAPGNHDPFSSTPLYHSPELPQNVYIFNSEEVQVFSFDELGVTVCGYAMMTDRLETSPLESFTPPKTDNALILCAHADISSSASKYAPISMREIERCGFCYAALGHIHNPPIPESTRSLVRYCGFPMGRAFDELCDGGALSVTIENGRASAERIIFSEHRFIEEALDVSSAESGADIAKMIEEHIDAHSYARETSLRLLLTGTVPLYCVISPEKLEAMSTPLSLLKIKDLTLPMPDAKELKSDITLRGELYRTLLPRLESENADERRLAAEALRIGLYAIDGRNLADILKLD